MIFSASSIKRWMTCPKQEHFHKTLRREEPLHAKTAFGSCIHDAFKLYNDTGDLNAAVERFKATWRKPELICGQKIDVWPTQTTYSGLLKKGIDIIAKQAEREKWEKANILASEYGFCVPFGDYELRGYIDRMDAIPNSGSFNLKLIDYKTGRKPWKDQLALDVQFTVYQYASTRPEFWTGYTDSEGKDWEGFSNGEELYEVFDGRPRELIWFDLNVGKEILLPVRDNADIERVYRVCTEIEKAVKAEVYVPNISGDSCKFCVYDDVCPVVMPVRHKLEGYVDED